MGTIECVGGPYDGGTAGFLGSEMVMPLFEKDSAWKLTDDEGTLRVVYKAVRLQTAKGSRIVYIWEGLLSMYWDGLLF